MKAPLDQLSRPQIKTLLDWRCEHRHDGISHYNCYLKAHPEGFLYEPSFEERHLFLSDAHCPFHDRISIELVFDFAYDWQPHYVWVPGDWLDFYQISSFDKDPKRINDLQRDIDTGHDMLQVLKGATASAEEWHFLEGNHERRLQRFLWKHPEIASLRCLELEELLGLNDLGYIYHSQDEDVLINDRLYVTHGDVIRTHSGWTARAHYDKLGGNGVCAHAHRMGFYIVSKRGDTEGWWENPCLCDLNPEYVKSPNWQQGFTLARFIGDRFFIEQVPIIKHQFVVEGKLYK